MGAVLYICYSHSIYTGMPKKVYKDRPRFKLIEEYEGRLKSRYNSVLVEMVKNIGSIAKEIVKE